jgi:hypothetical protein
VLRKEAVIALWSRTKVILDAYATQWIADNVATRLAAADQATLKLPPTGWFERAITSDNNLFIDAAGLLSEWPSQTAWLRVQTTGNRKADGTGNTAYDAKGNQQPHRHRFRLGWRSPCHGQPLPGRLTPYPVPRVRGDDVFGQPTARLATPEALATSGRRILATNLRSDFS